MKIDGTGLIATALQAQVILRPGYIFARGVANSLEEDEAQYNRELRMLGLALQSGGEAFWYISSVAAQHPETRYGAHKLRCEDLVLRSLGSVIRLTNTVGHGGHPNQLIPSLIRQAKSGLVTVQHGAKRDILDVDDAALLIKQVIAKAGRGTMTSLGSGVATPVSELVDEICRLLDVRPGIYQVAGGSEQRVEMAEPFDAGYPFRVLAKYVR